MLPVGAARLRQVQDDSGVPNALSSRLVWGVAAVSGDGASVAGGGVGASAAGDGAGASAAGDGAGASAAGDGAGASVLDAPSPIGAGLVGGVSPDTGAAVGSDCSVGAGVDGTPVGRSEPAGTPPSAAITSGAGAG